MKIQDMAKIIFNDWGILSFSQLNSEPGDRYITEIVEFSKKFRSWSRLYHLGTGSHY